MKLQKFIALQGYCSRRKAEELIASGAVLVNGQTAHIGQVIDPQQDKVVIGGKALNNEQEEKLYFLVNKPVGLLSTTSDELGRKTVLSLVPHITTRLYPVGRLDLDSSGLMLLTNDGDLTYQMTHPKFEHSKTYEVLVEGTPTEKALAHLERGVLLKEGYTSPAQVEIADTIADTGFTWVRITIHEGRYHQVKRMFLRVGYEVLELVRTEFGPWKLDDLEDEPFKQLSAEDIQQSMKTAFFTE